MATAYLLVYSGAEGPAVRLSQPDANAVLTDVRRLHKVAPEDPIMRAGLATGGVMIDFSDDPSAGIGGIIAKDGVVAVYARGSHEPRYLLDEANIGGRVRARF